MQSSIPLLLVTGEDQDHRSLNRILDSDCSVFRAASRSDAASLIREHRPWVVICDEVLPDGDWHDLLADLADGQYGTPLIVSSRLADDRLWAEVLNLGGYDLLEKPFTPVEVSRVVKMAARRGSRASSK